MHRKESLDLLKIIAMWFIMTAHFMGWGGAVNSLAPQDANYYWVMPLYFITQIGNTLFFLISGYFFSECKVEKALFLERKAAFYAVVLSCLAGVLNGWKASMLQSFFPIVFDFYWFISIYLILYLLGSILRHGCETVSKKHFLIGLLALLFHNLFLAAPKYTLFEGLMAFLAGLYIRRFHPFRSAKKTTLAMLFAIAMLLYAVERVAVLKVGIEHTKADEAFRYILIFAAAVFLFAFFELFDLSGDGFSFFSKNIVAVYLITAHPYLRNELYQSFLHIEQFCHNSWFIVYYVLVNAALLFVCVMIDKLVSWINRKEVSFWLGLTKRDKI
ncbi:MAG: acyltransferase [Oscillospiraceae bacterium]|nr:acyltransferase [Oscillospiraceae bacterium]